MKEEKIQGMYLELINEYGRALPPQDRAEAKRIFRDLTSLGFSYEWLYWAVWNLGKRNLLSNQGLLFHKGYQEEVSSIAANARKAYWDGLETKKILRDFSIAAFGGYFGTDEDLERILYYDDVSFNEGRETFTEEELEEIEQLYLNNFVKQQVSISKEEWEEERSAVIEQLKDMKKYVDYKTIPHHPYTEEKPEPPPLTREKDTLGFYYKQEE